MNIPSNNYTAPYSRTSSQLDDYDDSAHLNAETTQDSPRNLATRTPFYASSSSSSTELNSQRANRPPSRTLLYPVTANQYTPSHTSTASATPEASRAASPLYVQEDDASTCSSDGEDTELESSLLHDSHRRSFSLTDTPRWWLDGPSRRRRREPSWYRAFKRTFLPFVPKTPLTIVRRPCLGSVYMLTYTLTVFRSTVLCCVRYIPHLSHHIPLQPGQATFTLARLLHNTQLFN